MTTFPGPAALGRGIVIGVGAPPPPEAATWPRIEIDDAVVAAPRAVVDQLHVLWSRREPVVIELASDPGPLREPEASHGAPWEVGTAFEFERERLQYLLWSNNYDWRDRSGEPIWWHGRRAVKLGCLPSGSADVELSDGTPAWCDGGPRGPLAIAGADLLHRETIEAGSLRPDRVVPSSSHLAVDQRAAVEHGAGPARIIAPAGSGKTRVLTERLRHLLADRLVTPGNVLAVAFNKRAADELLERTAGLPAHIRTLNSLGLAIVNGTAPFAPVGERRAVIDEREVRQILEGLVSVKRQQNTDPYLPYLDALSMIRLGLVDPSVAGEEMPDAIGIAEVFEKYRALLADRGLVDFDEQIYLAIERLLREPETRRRAQTVARHLLVDEFQDLTPAHLLMLRLMAAPTYDVFGVGDDDQVIYSYAGANPEFLIDYDANFPGASLYALETNYRCPVAVVRGATTLLEFNRRRVPKTIHARPGLSEEPDSLVLRTCGEEEEAEVVAAAIAALGDAGVAYSDIAVLTRVNSSLLPIQVVLTERGVPCSKALGPEVLERTGVRTALAYLRIGARPDAISRADISETIRRPSRKIARNVAEMLRKNAHTSVRGIRRLAGALTGADADRLDDYAADLEAVALAVSRGTTAAALRMIRQQVGLGGAMDVLDSGRREADRSSHIDDLAALQEVAHLHENAATFESWLRGQLSAPRAPARTGGEVTLATVHRVKGQEWPEVFVLGASRDLFPHRLASDVEEERRIFHVAITRGSRHVTVVADSLRPSRFCDEMLGRVPVAARLAEGSVAIGGTTGSRPGLEARPRASGRGASASPGSGSQSTPGQAQDSGDREGLSKALRQWRRETASRDKVPAYVVLSDADLEGIVTRRPTTLRELSRCRGIGQLKLERYGDDILAVLAAATEDGASTGAL
jgi:DNA helicase-2/ATP-dependent DNA helicase PcrA